MFYYRLSSLSQTASTPSTPHFIPLLGVRHTYTPENFHIHFMDSLHHSNPLLTSMLLLSHPTFLLPPFIRCFHLSHKPTFSYSQPFFFSSVSHDLCSLRYHLHSLRTLSSVLRTLHTAGSTSHVLETAPPPKRSSPASSFILLLLSFRHAFHPRVCLAENHLMRCPFRGLSSDSPPRNVGLQRESWERE